MIKTFSSHTKSFWWSDSLFIFLIILFFYSIFLGSYPLLVPDEGRYSDVAREMIRTGNYLTPFSNGIPFFDKPPLFYWIQTVFVRFIGFNEWGFRLWPITIAALGCVGTYITGRMLFNRRTGWIAAIILGSSLHYFVMAHIANLDLTVAIFITFSLFSFLCALERPSSKLIYLCAAYIFVALAILTKGLIGIVIPIMIIGLWILISNSWKLLPKIHLITGTLIIITIVVPWFYKMNQYHPNFLHYFFYTQQFHRYVANNFNSHHGLWFYPAVLLIGTFPWTFYVIATFVQKIKITWGNKNQHQKYLFLLIWIMSVTIFFSIPKSKTIGYLLPVFPAIALITASYLQEKIYSKKSLLPVMIPMIISLCCYPIIMFVISEMGTQFGLTSSKPLALLLKNKLKPDDLVIFYEYYYQDLAVYLDRTVLVAGDFEHEKLKDDWREDFSEGLKNPKYTHSMITAEQFRTLWQSKKTIYVFTLSNQINAFKNLIPSPHLIGHYQQLWVFKNAS